MTPSDPFDPGGFPSRGHAVRLERKSHMQLATTLIKAAIMDGQILPGERLNEIRLAEKYGISRTPVRAALQELAGAGYLIYERNRGYSLRNYSDSEISIAYEARGSLEGLAARISAERGINESSRFAFERNILAGERAVNSTLSADERIRLFRKINAEFHDVLLDAAESDLLRGLINACQTIPIAAPQHIKSFSHRYLRLWQDDHCQIFEAILAREPVRAERLVREHVAGLRSYVLLNRKTNV